MYGVYGERDNQRVAGKTLIATFDDWFDARKYMRECNDISEKYHYAFQRFEIRTVNEEKVAA